MAGAAPAIRRVRRWVSCHFWERDRRISLAAIKTPCRVACVGCSTNNAKTAICAEIRATTRACTPTAKPRLCCATGDEELRDPAQRAVDFIVAAQHPAGGWRYQPKQPGDTSVVGWQVMALQSARAAGLDVPDATLELTGQYLDSVSSRDGALYAYQPSNGPTEVMTAEALLCRMYLGWTLDEPGLREGIAYLATRHLPDPRQTNIYYWYYGTQALHHHGGPEWEAWNARMRDILIATQEDRGHQAGSWDPEGPHASAGGRVYMTALAVCSLEVYYRHLPIFRQLSLE